MVNAYASSHIRYIYPMDRRTISALHYGIALNNKMRRIAYLLPSGVEEELWSATAPVGLTIALFELLPGKEKFRLCSLFLSPKLSAANLWVRDVFSLLLVALVLLMLAVETLTVVELLDSPLLSRLDSPESLLDMELLC